MEPCRAVGGRGQARRIVARKPLLRTSVGRAEPLPVQCSVCLRPLGKGEEGLKIHIRKYLTCNINNYVKIKKCSVKVKNCNVGRRSDQEERRRNSDSGHITKELFMASLGLRLTGALTDDDNETDINNNRTILEPDGIECGGGRLILEWTAPPWNVFLSLSNTSRCLMESVITCLRPCLYDPKYQME
jgi:hypothetical protein